MGAELGFVLLLDRPGVTLEQALGMKRSFGDNCVPKLDEVGNEGRKMELFGERWGRRTGSFTVLVRFWTEKNKFHLWRQQFFKIFCTCVAHLFDSRVQGSTLPKPSLAAGFRGVGITTIDGNRVWEGCAFRSPTRQETSTADTSKKNRGRVSSTAVRIRNSSAGGTVLSTQTTINPVAAML